MDSEVALYFRNEFREARAAALKDAEGYQQILFVLERFGAYEKGRCEGDEDKIARLLSVIADHIHPGCEGDEDKKAKGLDAYKECITALVKTHHPLEKHRKKRARKKRVKWLSLYRDSHTAFSSLYEMVMHGRNDALHQGAFARILTLHLVEVALFLEDTLMAIMGSKIKDYMIQNPVCASEWQPVSFVRQMMLANSFSYIPTFMKKKDTEEKDWHIIADYHIVEYLRSTDSREKLLAKPLKEASKDMPIELAYTVCPNKTVREVLKCAKYAEGKPILVVKRDNREELLGIATAFDLM